ncbi:S-Ena type endospore appendage [Peribacillus muralis]|uniref:S-Ena type endospore appendage n=1 Tax=Peribacillus muralis TaxID=264697 RepID=UPI003D073B09
MGNDKNKKCKCKCKCECKCEKKKKKKKKKTRSPEKSCFPIPNCDKKIFCTDICGNIHLDQDVHDLEIWKKELNEKTMVTVSVFNSAWSISSLQVFVVRMEGSPVVLNIPKGNTLSATIEDVISIFVVREEGGRVEGKFCLEICFPFRDKKSFFN